MQDKMHNINTKSKAFYNGVKSLYVAIKGAKKAQKQEQAKTDPTNDGNPDHDPINFQEKFMMNNLGLFVDTIWSYTVVDIESTLTKVCRKVFTDDSVGEEKMTKRIQALKIIGDIFMKKSVDGGKGLEEFKKKLLEQVSNIPPQ